MSDFRSWLFAAAIATFAALNVDAEPIDWDKAQELREGVKLVKIDEMSSVDIVVSDKKKIEEARGVPYDGKREMKSYVMRVDLSLKGLKTTATGRDADWGKPMPEDPKNRGKQKIRTKRQRTVDFMKEVAAREVEGRKAEVICGFNPAPWSPWPPPKHLYAVPSGVCISDGVDIKPTKAETGAFFVIDRKGKCSITDKRPSDTNDVWIVHSGFAIIMKDGKFLMVGNDRADYLYSVGGRIQFGETAQEAVVREVFEETGRDVSVDRLGFIHENYFIGDSPAKLGKVIYELSFYFYMNVPDDFEPASGSFTEDGSTEYLTWAAPDDERKMFPAFLRWQSLLHNSALQLQSDLAYQFQTTK